MGLLTLLPESKFGFGGKAPSFLTLPNPPASLHDTYSINGNPSSTKIISSNGAFRMPLPSILDEQDAHNHNLYKSNPGQRYTDNLPK